MTFLFSLKPKASFVLMVIGGSLLLIGVVLHIISMSTDYFALLTDGDAKYAAVNITGRYSENNLTGVNAQLNYGLWRLCVGAISISHKNQSKCYVFSTNGSLDNDIITSPYWLQSAQVLSIVGVLVAGGGVVAVIAWLLTDMIRCVNLLLVASVTLAVSGGILILSSDITFAAKYSVELYKIASNNIYFSPPPSTLERISFEIGTLDKLLDVGWSFALDIAAGSLCVLSALPLLVASVWTARTSETESSSTKSPRKNSPENVEFVPIAEGDTHF